GQEQNGVGNGKSQVMWGAAAEGSVPEGTGLKLRREGASAMSCCRREEADVSLSR
ncbi:Multidrug resistance protein MdtG, partial [Clarias magur]